MGRKVQEYEYRDYRAIADITGFTLPCEWQRTQRTYKKLAKGVVNELMPQLSDEDKALRAEQIVGADWWEDMLRGAYEQWCIEKKQKS